MSSGDSKLSTPELENSTVGLIQNGKGGDGSDNFSKKLVSSSSQSDEPLPGNVRMQKEIGLFTGVSVIAGIIIGSGIFLSPKGVIEETGSVGMALIVWVVCGVLSTIGALCYAELGTTIPRSGGDYEYIREALGSLPSFIYLWSAIITILPAGNAVIAITFGNYILQPFFSDCAVPKLAARIVAFLCLSILTYLNCRNVKWVTRIQGFFTITKLMALAIIIIAGIVHVAQGNLDHLRNPFAGTKLNVGAISKSFYSGLFSYSGWNYLNFLTEEVKDPYKNLPRAIWISMPLVTIVYFLANAAYFAVLSLDTISSSEAVAVDFSNIMFGPAAWIMPILVACSTFGAVNGTLLSSSRLFFIGARYGHLPDLLAVINVNYLTPIPAVLVVGGISIIMLAFNNVFDLLNYATYVEVASQTVCVVALLWLRYSRPELERPIKVNLALPIIFIFVGAFLFIAPIPEDVAVFGGAILIVAAAVPVYFVLVYAKRHQTDSTKNFIRKLTIFTQKLTYSAKEDELVDGFEKLE